MRHIFVGCRRRTVRPHAVLGGHLNMRSLSRIISAPMPLWGPCTYTPASPFLERRSLIEIQDECQKAAYHKHDRDQNHRCLLQYRIEIIIAMRGHYTGYTAASPYRAIEALRKRERLGYVFWPDSSLLY
jgi:hypothetical protein